MPANPDKINQNSNQADIAEIQEISADTKEKLDQADGFSNILTKEVANPLWLSISEAAKIGGVQNKTVRRAIMAKAVKYKLINNRYLIDLASFVQYLNSSTKLRNKLNQNGIGQYVDIWRY